MSDPGPEIAFHAGEGGGAPDRAALARDLARLAAEFPRRLSRVDVLLVGDAEMARLHGVHSGVAETTDVLSFPAHDERDPGCPVEVDLVVSTEVAAREAAERGHPVEQEILLYVVHGTLHACGYRDDSPESAAAIHAEEDRILAAAGIGPTYARGRVGPEAPDAGDRGSRA